MQVNTQKHKKIKKICGDYRILITSPLTTLVPKLHPLSYYCSIVVPIFSMLSVKQGESADTKNYVHGFTGTHAVFKTGTYRVRDGRSNH